jgi:bone morphogenetic protein 7
MHRAINNNDQQEIELEILELLGLPDRPRKRHIHPPSMRKSAPKFLLDIYHRLSGTEETQHTHSRITRSSESEEDTYLTKADQQAIDHSDIIMTFLNKNHHVAEVRHEKGRRLWFDINEIDEDEVSLVMAELRFYQSPEQSKWKTRREFTINIYAIGSLDGKEDLELIATKNTTNFYQGWFEVDMSNLLHSWIQNKVSNKGLYISAEASDRQTAHEVKLEDIGLVTSKGDEEHQPFMVGFFKGQQIVSTKAVKKSHSRVKRNAVRRKKKVSEHRNPMLHGPEKLKSCQIQTLYVSFKDLKWQDWIVVSWTTLSRSLKLL